MQEERLYTVGCFTKTSFLDIHIAQSLFLVLRSIETDVRKCIFPKYLGGGPVQGKEAYLGRMHFLTTISVGPNFYNLIFVNRSTAQLCDNQLLKMYLGWRGWPGWVRRILRSGWRTKRCLAGGQLLFETTINCSQVSFELMLLSTMNGFLISALVLGFFEINSYLRLWRKYLNPISKY